MPIITEAEKPFWQRLLWFVLLWGCGVGAVATVGLLIRLVLKP